MTGIGSIIFGIPGVEETWAKVTDLVNELIKLINKQFKSTNTESTANQLEEIFRKRRDVADDVENFIKQVGVISTIF